MNPPLSRDQLLRLIPHAGRMCLLDRVVDYSESEIHCATRTHLDPANPLRRDHALSALHLVEYAAQAMAAHGALHAGGQPQPGMLAALRDIRLHAERIDSIDGELDIRPPYQREFIYGERERAAVINTVFKGYPLNVMYWAVRDDGGYEVIDGQQRTLSICQYVDGDFAGRKLLDRERVETRGDLSFDLVDTECLERFHVEPRGESG